MAQTGFTDITSSTAVDVFWQNEENSTNSLRTRESGSSAPSSPVAHQVYVNTTDNILYERNSANTAWSAISTVDQTKVLSKTSNYTLVIGDLGKTILVDATSGAVTITLLPSATAGADWKVRIKRVDSSSNTVIIDANASETIDGSTTKSLDNQFDSMNLVCDASNFHIISEKSSTVLTPRKNLFINSEFLLEQEGTSFTGTTDIYTLDLWKKYVNSGGANVDVSRQSFTAGQTSVPGNPKYYVNVVCASSASADKQLIQNFEDVTKYSGESLTISFYAKAAGSDASAFKFYLLQDFGSGGSADVETKSAVQAISTSWAKYTYTFSVPSVSGKTIGSIDHLRIGLEFPTAYAGTFSFATPKVEVGTTATQWEKNNYSKEMDCVNYFYYKTHSKGIAPGSADQDNGHPNFRADSVGSAFLHLQWPKPMRASPSIQVYKPSDGTTGQFETVGQSGTYTVSSTEHNEKALTQISEDGSNLVAGDYYQALVTADARI